PLHESRSPRCPGGGGSGPQITDGRQLARLLPARRERPCHGRAAKQRDELATAAHSITSSASNWIELGTSMPSALAVCTLMTNSNLVDCKTGRSAGFVIRHFQERMPYGLFVPEMPNE